MTLRRNQLAALAGAIERVMRFDAPADAALSAFFREHPEIGDMVPVAFYRAVADVLAIVYRAKRKRGA